MLRLCVVGSGGVGKSCLSIRYLKNEFTEYYDPTLEETYQASIEINGRHYEFEIVDTAGQEEFTSFRDSSLAKGDAFLVLYAINSACSWTELRELRGKVIRENIEGNGSQIPMVIVGNKVDLEDEREVNKEEVVEFCNSIVTPYIETSAKTGLNVQECFQLMMRQIMRVDPSMLERTLAKSKDDKSKKKECTVA